jgi:hypothetical protein
MWKKGFEEKNNGTIASYFLKYVGGRRVFSSRQNKEGLNFVTYEQYAVDLGGNSAIQSICHKTVKSLSRRTRFRCKGSASCNFVRRILECLWVGDRRLHLTQV